MYKVEYEISQIIFSKYFITLKKAREFVRDLPFSKNPVSISRNGNFVEHDISFATYRHAYKLYHIYRARVRNGDNSSLEKFHYYQELLNNYR